MKDKGQLIYMVGASGCGKDSLIAYARQSLLRMDKVLFAHRYITRPPADGGENHIALKPEEFLQRLENGLFAMHWQSHGYRYGIGIEIDHWLSKGCKVVVNGSRSYLPTARDRYPNLKMVWIDVSHGKLKRRLEARGRETAAQIMSRLDRNRELKRHLICSIPDTIIINNEGLLDTAGEILVSHLSNL
jgi:ribose 1,5-bisphosphokinase